MAKSLTLLIVILAAFSIAAAPPLAVSVPVVQYPPNNGNLQDANLSIQWSDQSGAIEWDIIMYLDGALLGSLTDSSANFGCDGLLCFATPTQVLGGPLPSPGLYTLLLAAGDGSTWSNYRVVTFRAWAGYNTSQNGEIFIALGDGPQPYLAQFYVVVLAAFGVTYLLLRIAGVSEQSYLLWWGVCLAVALVTRGYNAASVVYVWYMASSLLWLIMRALSDVFGLRWR